MCCVKQNFKNTVLQDLQNTKTEAGSPILTVTERIDGRTSQSICNRKGCDDNRKLHLKHDDIMTHKTFCPP